MKTTEQKIIFFKNINFSCFTIGIAKLYPTPIFGITKVFEQGQLIPMGFSELCLFF